MPGTEKIFADLHVHSFYSDGIECYYPSHSDEVTKACLDICKERNLIITAGSDCHRVFGKARVGEMNIEIGKLKLKNLLPDMII